MSFLWLFQRLIVRPLGREPLRNCITVFAVALGAAAVVAIELAGQAATGSFRSSLETLTGEASFEISSAGGLDENLLGQLVLLPHPLRFSPRVEGYARLAETEETVPVIGLDLVGDPVVRQEPEGGSFSLDALLADDSVWAGRRLASQARETLALTIENQTRTYTVRGILDAEGFSGASAESVLVMDIAAAQRTLRKQGLVDRILVHAPEGGGEWIEILRAELPEGVTVEQTGARTAENRKMLGAFRWNLRVLSYIALIVGAFLIYNTISISVVRRRAEIGVLRALGASKTAVRLAFLGEAGFFGLLGGLIGLACGRVLAEGALRLMAATVEALYVSSVPGEIAFTPAVWLAALAAGPGVALLAAAGPAAEASRVPPSDAIAHGRHDYLHRQRAGRRLLVAAALAASAAAAAQAPPVGGKPLFGYLAAVLLIGALALAAPAVVQAVAGAVSHRAHRWLGAEGFLAPRGLIASLGRTSVLVAALGTATAMMVSIAVMVGSFRETVALWMENQLRADFYLRPAGAARAGHFPTMDAAIADRIETLSGVQAVDRFRAYPIRYNGMPATLGGGQTSVHGRWSQIRLLPGAEKEEVLKVLPTGNFALVSEPFANKHDLGPGDTVRLALQGRQVAFEVLAVYYDYSNERGYVIVDRGVLLNYLPDPAPSNLAVYLEPGSDAAVIRRKMIDATAGHELLIHDNRSLRRQALEVFDRTFAITYALEAVAVTVAVFGMAGALLALVFDRRREVGVLRFLGASAGQIRRLIVFEAGLLGLIANGAGAVLGLALSLVLIYVINKQSFGWTIQFHWPEAVLLGGLSLIYAACLVSALYPARLAASLDPIEAVHEE